MAESSEWKDPWKLEVEGCQSLWSLHASLRARIKEAWNRGVPFADEFTDRWERASFLGFGRGASIYDSSLVLGDVTVGEETWIGPFTVLDGRGGLTIGRHCSISAGVQVYSHDTVKWALTAGKAPEERHHTTIGDCCYIGPMTIVAAGVEVGERSVVGANSFVSRDVDPFSVVAGSPARLIGRVELVGEDDVRLVYE